MSKKNIKIRRVKRIVHNAVLQTLTVIAFLMLILGAGSADSTGDGAWLSMILVIVGMTWLGLFFYANDKNRKGGR